MVNFYLKEFTEQSFGKFTQLFRIKCETLKKKIFESSAFYSEHFCTFDRFLFRKCLYPQPLNGSINFIELLKMKKCHQSDLSLYFKKEAFKFLLTDWLRPWYVLVVTRSYLFYFIFILSTFYQKQMFLTWFICWIFYVSSVFVKNTSYLFFIVMNV